MLELKKETLVKLGEDLTWIAGGAGSWPAARPILSTTWVTAGKAN